MICRHCQMPNDAGRSRCLYCHSALASADGPHSTEPAGETRFSQQTASTASDAVAAQLITQISDEPASHEAASDAQSGNSRGTGSDTASPDKTAPFGTYQLVREAGQGGMGIVYQAFDTVLQRPVALKVLRQNESHLSLSHSAQPSSAQSHQARQKLLAEARLASSLQHPNIVTVHDIVLGNERSYIVTEWLQGQTLDQYQQRPLTLAAKLALLVQVAEGLSCAHQAGVIHRDLKPSNLMICLPEQRVKILDFGMASRQHRLQQAAASNGASLPPLPPMLSSQLHSHWSAHTTAHQLKGTLPYLAPELLQSDQDATVQSDIFAFGVILYELLYGVHPFLHDSAEQTMQAILQHRVNPPPPNQPKLPARLSKLIERCLTPQASRRPDEMAPIARQLRELTNELQKREKLGVFYPLSRWPVWLGLAPVLLALSLWLGQQSIDKDKLLSQGQTLALQPFDNLGGDPAVQQFLQGMALSLSQDLAKIGQHNNQVWVLPPGELANLKEPSLKNIYQRYQSDLIISGTLQHLGATRRLSLNLHNGADGRILKSSELDLPLNGWDVAQQQVRQELLQLLNWQQPADLTLSKGSATSDEAYKAYLTGLSYLYRFDYKDNIENGVQQLERAIADAPDFTEAKYALIAGYLRMARLRDLKNSLRAAESLSQQLAATSDSSTKLLELNAEIAKLRSDYQGSVRLYKQVISEEPYNATALFGLSGVLQFTGDIAGAEKYLLAATQVSNNWHFRNQLAIFYYRHSQLDKAARIYADLLLETPNNTQTLQTLGAIYFAQNKNKEALDAFEKALALNPTANNYSNVATVWFYEQNYDLAIKYYQTAVDLNADSYVLRGNLADSHRWAGNDQLAKTHYLAAITLIDQRLQESPNQPAVLINKALYLAKLGEEQLPLDIIEQLPALKETNMLIIAAQIYLLTGKQERAIDLLKQALAKGYSFEMLQKEPELKILLQNTDLQQHQNSV